MFSHVGDSRLVYGSFPHTSCAEGTARSDLVLLQGRDSRVPLRDSVHASFSFSEVRIPTPRTQR